MFNPRLNQSVEYGIKYPIQSPDKGIERFNMILDVNL